MLRIFDRLDGRKSASFSLAHLAEIKAQLDEGIIHGVAVDTPLFTQKEIDLLADFKNIQTLAFRFNKNRNISLDFVKDLPLLDDFGVDGICPTIDFDIFKNLKTLIIDWNPKVFKNADKSKLTELHLWKLKAEDFEPLAAFSSVERLLLNKSTMSTLNGVDNYKSLKVFKLIYMANLKDISAISGLSLEKFSIQNAKKIADYSPIGSCEKISRLRVIDSAPIESLKFIEGINHLKSFRFMKTDVIDGDLSPLLGLNDVDFTPKKHFSHTLKAFKRDGFETSFC